MDMDVLRQQRRHRARRKLRRGIRAFPNPDRNTLKFLNQPISCRRSRDRRRRHHRRASNRPANRLVLHLPTT